MELGLEDRLYDCLSISFHKCLIGVLVFPKVCDLAQTNGQSLCTFNGSFTTRFIIVEHEDNRVEAGHIIVVTK